MNVEDLLEDPTPRLPAGMLDNLMRAQQAVSLLAAVTHPVTRLETVELTQIAALASYVSEDMDSLLTGIEYVEAG